MTAKALGLIVASALLGGWLLDTASQEPSARTAPAAAQRRGARPLGAGNSTSTPLAEHWRERLNKQPATPARGRNPFVYGARSAPSRGSSRQAEAVEPEVETRPAPPPVPMFKLSGIAANTDNGVTVLTAIVIDNGVLVFAKAGDKLSRGYTVVRVDETSVTLADADGVTETLRLP